MDFIDVARQWIEEKDASYLAKEDKVVWFSSITGRATDKDWQEMSLQQVLRVIKYTLSEEVELKDIISAFQELGSLYEMGVHSKFQTPSNIFNYAEHSPLDMSEKVVRAITQVVVDNNITGMTLSQLNQVFDKVCTSMAIKITTQKRNRLYEKYFELLGYAMRTGTNRVSINGKKVTVVLHKAYTPNGVNLYGGAYLNNLAALVVAKVKG